MIVTTTVYYKDLADEFKQGGQGGRWIHMVAQQMEALSIATAPTRSHELADSHIVERTAAGPGFFGNQYVAAYTITNFAPHAENVHEGYPRGATVSIPDAIWADSDEGMSVPRIPGQAFPRTRRQSVAGQARQPWMDNACTAVAARYGAIPYG